MQPSRGRLRVLANTPHCIRILGTSVVDMVGCLAAMMQDEDQGDGLLHVDCADTMAHSWRKVTRWNVRMGMLPRR